VARGGGGPEDPEAAFSAAEGSGGRITLHMARRVAEALGGTLTAEGGETTRFRLSLPA
jgi:signal transduction histidine kinase